MRASLQPLIAPRGHQTPGHHRRIGKKSTPKLKVTGAKAQLSSGGCVPEVIRSSEHGIKLNISQMLRDLHDESCGDADDDTVLGELYPPVEPAPEDSLLLRLISSKADASVGGGADPAIGFKVEVQRRRVVELPSKVEVPKAHSMLKFSNLDYYVHGLQTSRMTLNARSRQGTSQPPTKFKSCSSMSGVSEPPHLKTPS